MKHSLVEGCWYPIVDLPEIMILLYFEGSLDIGNNKSSVYNEDYLSE